MNTTVKIFAALILFLASFSVQAASPGGEEESAVPQAHITLLLDQNHELDLRFLQESKSTFTLAFDDNAAEVSITLFNEADGIVLTKTVNAKEFSQTFSTENLEKGKYQLLVEYGQASTVETFEVK